MKKKYLLMPLLTILFFGCKQEKPTDKETESFNKVLHLYEGNLKLNTAYTNAGELGRNRFADLELKESRLIEALKNDKISSSGVAYNYYKNLGDEKEKYYSINVTLISKAGITSKHEYSAADLSIVDTKMAVVNNLVEQVKTGDPLALNQVLDSTNYFEFDRRALISGVKEMNAEMGHIKDYTFLGYRVDKFEEGKKFLHISIQLNGTIKSYVFSVDLDVDRTDNKVLLFNYVL